MKDLMITNNELTMNSLEIAELTGKRHDNVRRVIESLISKGVIQLPQIEIIHNNQSLSANNKTRAYLFSGEKGKRDSIIVVAQLSPEFTAALVDRWKELEESAFKVPSTFAEALQLAADQAKKIELLAHERDEAIKTKAQIGSKREASAMARASAEARKAKALEIKLDQSREYASIKRMAKKYGGFFNWRLLKKASEEMGLSIERVEDANYDEINSYHKDVWLKVYGLEVK